MNALYGVMNVIVTDMAFIENVTTFSGFNYIMFNKIVAKICIITFTRWQLMPKQQRPGHLGNQGAAAASMRSVPPCSTAAPDTLVYIRWPQKGGPEPAYRPNYF